MEDDLYEKQDSKDKKEIMDTYDAAVARTRNNYWVGSHSSSAYSVQLNNIEKTKNDDLQRLEERLGIPRLKEDIKQLEKDIREQREKLSKF